MPPATSLQCGNCGGKCGLMKCGKCSCVGYCNIFCQTAHWQIHKQLCHGKLALGVESAQRKRAPVEAPTFRAASSNCQVVDVQLLSLVTEGLVFNRPLLPSTLGELVGVGARFCVPLTATLACLNAPLCTTAMHLVCCLPADKLAGSVLHCPAADVMASARSWGMLPLAGPVTVLGELYTPLGAAISVNAKTPLAVAWLLRTHPPLVLLPCLYTRLPYSSNALELFTPLQAACAYFASATTDEAPQLEACVMLVLQACIAVGAPLGDITPESGRSALELLVGEGFQLPSAARSRLVAALLAAGATPVCRQVNASGGRALDYAARQGDVGVFAALLGAGASLQPIALRGLACTTVGEAYKHEDTVTWPVLAVERAHLGVLRLALAAGLSPNVRNCDFFAMPLLCTAVHYCMFECARVLLEERAGGEALLVNALFPIIIGGGGWRLAFP